METMCTEWPCPDLVNFFNDVHRYKARCAEVKKAAGNVTFTTSESKADAIEALTMVMAVLQHELIDNRMVEKELYHLLAFGVVTLSRTEGIVASDLPGWGAIRSEIMRILDEDDGIAPKYRWHLMIVRKWPDQEFVDWCNDNAYILMDPDAKKQAMKSTRAFVATYMTIRGIIGTGGDAVELATRLCDMYDESL
jgi:hypothetical protein